MDLKEWQAAEGTPRHPWELARLDAVEFLVRRDCFAFGSQRQMDLRILDFGCGDAFVASALAERLAAKEVVAVDSAFTAVTQAHLLPGLSPRVKLYDSMNVAAQNLKTPVSLVLLLDVLEHCESDRSVLEMLIESPAVAPDARFLITVPAFQSLFCRHDTFLGHYRRYRRPSLVDLARQSGLEVLESSYFFSSLLIPRGGQVLLERLGLSKAPPKGLGERRSGWADPLISGILKADFRVCEALARAGVYLPGLSCFVIAQKKNGPLS